MCVPRDEAARAARLGALLQSLQAVDVYVRRQAEICDSLLVYDNDAQHMELKATVCGGRGVEEALALASRYLGASS